MSGGDLDSEGKCEHCGKSGDEPVLEMSTGDTRHVYRSCPFSHVGQLEADLVKYADLLDCGVLPSVGGLEDQAAAVVDAIWLCRRVMHAEENKLEKRRERDENTS